MTESFGGSVGEVRLRTFGSADLTAGEGGEADALMAQPKRFALLCYLAIPKPGRMVRRDTLLGVFWPEGDLEHTRMALRQALKYVRKTLGQNVILRRGSEEVSLNPDLFWCDVAAFEQELAASNLSAAADLYCGELLPGFVLSKAPEFERWLDTERMRLASRYATAVEQLANTAAADGNLRAAVEWWQSLVRHDPFDSRHVKSLMEALERAGDPANALLYARKHRQLLRDELNITLPAEIKALEQRVRGENDVVSTVVTPEARAVELLGLESGNEVWTDSNLTERQPEQSDLETASKSRHLARGVKVAFVVAFATAVAASIMISIAGHGPKLDRQLVVVAPLENLTGDPTLEDLGYMAADWMRRAILQIGDVGVVPGAFIRPDPEINNGGGSGQDVRSMAERAKAGLAVDGTITSDNDSLYFHVEIVDVAAHKALQCFDETWPKGIPREAIGILGQRVSGALAAESDPYMTMMSRSMPCPPTLEAYREHRLGYHFFDLGEHEESLKHQTAAYALDTSLVRAVVAAGYAARDYHQKDSLARFAERRRHLLSRSGQLDLDVLVAMVAGRWRDALHSASELARLEGGNAYVTQAWLAVHANQPQLAVKALAQYGPNLDWRRKEPVPYWHVLAVAHHMLGNHEQELIEARRGREQYPERLDILNLEVRAMAALGDVEHLGTLLDAAATYLPHGDFSNWQPYFLAGTELREHGHTEVLSQQLFERSVEWLQTHPSEEASQADHQYALARSLHSARRWEEAQGLFARLAADFPDSQDHLSYLGYLGVTAARTGRSTLTSHVSAQLGELSRPGVLGENTLWLARIIAVLDRPDEAMRLLRKAFREGVTHGVWLSADLTFASLHDRADFQELKRPNGYGLERVGR